MADEFVRARCPATGHIAALPKLALELGHIVGWVAVDGPVPDGPKPAAFPERYSKNAKPTNKEKKVTDHG